MCQVKHESSDNCWFSQVHNALFTPRMISRIIGSQLLAIFVEQVMGAMLQSLLFTVAFGWTQVFTFAHFPLKAIKYFRGQVG